MNRVTLLTALALLFSSGCSGTDSPADPTQLRIGVLPEQDRETLAEQYAPLLDHIHRELGIPCELVIPESYTQLVELFCANEIDLGFFGGVTFIRASESADALPLVYRDVDRNFTSYVIVEAENPATELADLKGQDFCFGSPLSTSGHYMPRHFLRGLGLDPERHFGEVSFSGSHDETVRRVRDGLVSAGALNSQILGAMLRDGRVKEGEVRVLWESPTYVNYVWGLRAAIGEDLRARIRDAFLMLSEDDAEHAQVLDSLRAKHFLPATSHDFLELREVVLEGEQPSGP